MKIEDLSREITEAEKIIASKKRPVNLVWKAFKHPEIQSLISKLFLGDNFMHFDAGIFAPRVGGIYYNYPHHYRDFQWDDELYAEFNPIIIYWKVVKRIAVVRAWGEEIKNKPSEVIIQY